MAEVALPKVIVEELRERASRAGVTVEVYLLDMLMEGVDPVEGAGKYLEGAEELLEQAREELEKGDLRQASEKIWGACALAVKAHALTRRRVKLESHRDLWMYKNEVARELGEWIRVVFRQADSMHRNFYENLATREDVEDVLKEVGKLVAAIMEVMRKQN